MENTQSRYEKIMQHRHSDVLPPGKRRGMAKRQTADVWLFRQTSSCRPPKVVLFVGTGGQFCPVFRLPAMQNTAF